MKVNKPDGTLYCDFSVDNCYLIISLPNGYKVKLDRKVIPDLKKFLDSQEVPKNFLEPIVVKNEIFSKGLEK